MKANVNDKIYIQKKDIELIIKSTNKESIPQNIIDSYEQNQNLKELDFLEFNNKSDIDFLNKFWFIVNYNDFKDFTELEIVNYRMNDLTKLRAMRQEYDKNYLLDNKIYTDIVDLLSERVYFIPNKNQAKKFIKTAKTHKNYIKFLLQKKYFTKINYKERFRILRKLL